VKAVVRQLTLVAATCAVLAGVSGCNTSPGAAAVVGSDRISTKVLQQAVDRALADPQAQAQLGADRAGFTRTELGRLINNKIIAAAAAAHHITVSAPEIDAQINVFAQQAGGTTQLLQQAAQGGVPKADLRGFIRFYVMGQKLADALVANVPVSQSQLQAAYNAAIDTYDQVHSAHILVKDKKTADTILAQVRRDPTQFAALAAKNSIDTSNKDKGGDLGFAGRGQFVAAFSNAIFAAKPGSFIEVHSKFGWHVVDVIAHRVTTLSQAAPALKANLLKPTRDQLQAKALAAAAKKLGIHVNPRYGHWDAAHLAVVATSPKQDVSSPSPSPSG
jgi:foldase protein PrsA